MWTQPRQGGTPRCWLGLRAEVDPAAPRGGVRLRRSPRDRRGLVRQRQVADAQGRISRWFALARLSHALSDGVRLRHGGLVARSDLGPDDTATAIPVGPAIRARLSAQAVVNSGGGGKAEGLPPCVRRDPSRMAQARDNRAPHAATLPAARGQKPDAIPGLVFAGSSSKALCGQMASRGWRCAIPHGRRRRAITGRPLRPHCLLHEVKSRMRSGGRFRRHAFKSASNGRCETSASCAAATDRDLSGKTPAGPGAPRMGTQRRVGAGQMLLGYARAAS